MLYKSIDANAEENDIINTAHCCDCNYTGNKGYWIGEVTLTMEPHKTKPLEGIVELRDDDTWDLDSLLSGIEDHEGVAGSADCPICKSPNFY